MPNSFDASNAQCSPPCLRPSPAAQAVAAPDQPRRDACDRPCIVEPAPVSGTHVNKPRFLCFELEEPGRPDLAAGADAPTSCPRVLVLIITDCSPEAMADWARRAGVTDLQQQPISIGEFGQRLGVLVELTRQRGRWPAHETPFPPQNINQNAALLNRLPAQTRTQPAVAHVASNFNQKIALDHVAALCRLSPSRFCRVFRQEQGVSFHQHLLRYRIARACERLSHPGALAKEVAYSCGFNDLSYFARAFKRQTGVCPSEYQSGEGFS
jgi:two-component system, response regulator YesN